MGLYFLIGGVRLLIGDSGVFVNTLPIDFGEYKNVAGVLSCVLGGIMIRLAIKHGSTDKDDPA
jgi:hypothetical protein